MIKKIYKKIVYSFFYYLYGKISNKKILKKFLKKRFFINSKDFINLYIINNCRIFTDCNTNVAYIYQNKIIPEVSYQQNKHNIDSVKFNSTLKIGTPKFKKYFKGNVLSLVQGASGTNYWHWLYDILPKIEILSKNGHLKKINYFYVPDINNFILETLECYGITKNKLINSKKYKHIFADEVYALEHLYLKKGAFNRAFEKIPKWIIIFLNTKFLKFKKKFTCPNRIFIDRSDSKFSHFRILNHEETKNYFISRGFKFYKLSQVNFFQQIYLFNNAKIIVGPHGAGFANLAFCKKNTKVYEILTENQSYRNGYQKVCQYMKLKHKKLIVKNNRFFKIQLDLNKVKKYFRRDG